MLERAEHRRRAERRARRSSSSTRSTASTRPSRTRCCRPSRRALITLIGATTENPYFEVNSALLSRAQVYELRTLGDDDVLALLRRALDDERGCDAPARSTTTRSSSSPRARAATRAPRWRRSSSPPRRRRRRHGHARARRGRAAAQGGALRQGRRPPLRHDLGLDQGDARLRPRRLAALPGGRCSRAARTRASSRGGW